MNNDPFNAPHYDPRPRTELIERAERNYPDNHYLQDEWCRAVEVVRSTTSGWIAERLVPRKDAP